METKLSPSAQVIRDLSVVRPWILRSTLATGFFARLAEKPHRIRDLANKLSADLTVFIHVIDYLVAIGYVQVSDEYASLTDLGHALAELPQDLYEPGSPILTFDLAATELESAWRHGGPVCSRRKVPYWEEVAQSKRACAVIGRYQPSRLLFDGAQLISAIAAELNSRSSSVLDLGGSNGALARDLSEIHGGKIGVLDLPEMIPNARENLSDFTEDRFSFHGSSFFDSIPADYDVYVLNSILYDYSDQHVQQLLANIYNSVPQHAVLIISETILAFPDAYTQAESSLMLTLNTGGRSRSPEDVVAAASSAGFRRVKYRCSSTERHTVVLER